MIVGASVIISAAYLVIGVAGYAHFGKDGTSDNIITNYHGLAGGALGLFTAARVGILGVVVCRCACAAPRAFPSPPKQRHHDMPPRYAHKPHIISPRTIPTSI